MRKSRALLLAFLLLITVAGLSYSQSDEILDSLLDQDPMSYGYAAYIVLTATDELPESATPQIAIGSSQTDLWGFDGKAVDSPTSYGEFSYMLMTTFGISGGLLYRAFPGPRYAAREMSFMQIAPNRVAPGKPLSGADAIQMLAGVMERTGSAE